MSGGSPSPDRDTDQQRVNVANEGACKASVLARASPRASWRNGISADCSRQQAVLIWLLRCERSRLGNQQVHDVLLSFRATVICARPKLVH